MRPCAIGYCLNIHAISLFIIFFYWTTPIWYHLMSSITFLFYWEHFFFHLLLSKINAWGQPLSLYINVLFNMLSLCIQWIDTNCTGLTNWFCIYVLYLKYAVHTDVFFFFFFFFLVFVLIHIAYHMQDPSSFPLPCNGWDTTNHREVAPEIDTYQRVTEISCWKDFSFFFDKLEKTRKKYIMSLRSTGCH